MIDWTKVTSDPNDQMVKRQILDYIKSIRFFYNGSWRDFLINNVKDKKTLDIGVVEHNIDYVKSNDWIHKQIKNSSSYCLGIDIIEDMVDYLNKQGFNIRCVYATSDVFLGEKFERINIGDVIEHVNNPVNLMKFAKRHLEKNGEIVITTPNPFFIGYFFKVLKKGSLIANLEHISWITPTMAMEIGRRANLKLYKIVIPKSKNIFKNLLINKFPELFRYKFIYVFKHNNND